MTRDGLWEILPFDAGTFTFAEDEPWAGEEGIVVAHALRAADGSVFLFDTGIARGDAAIDARYDPVERPLDDALAALGLGLADVRAATNCHLHLDHAGMNHRLVGVPIYVQRAERLLAATVPGHSNQALIGGPGVTYVEIKGDREVAPGLTILATPGHTAGHQSMVVETKAGRVLLTGQAIYSREEWEGRPGRQGRSSAPDRDAYDASVARLHALEPSVVRFAHDRRPWSRDA
jgi:glyoxylase-like metal-dependent hydrolase (beta-lactamase superfamily II)